MLGIESHQKSYNKIREISLYWFLKLCLCSDFDEFTLTGEFILTKKKWDEGYSGSCTT